jgi:hypothetical protein
MVILLRKSSVTSELTGPQRRADLPRLRSRGRVPEKVSFARRLRLQLPLQERLLRPARLPVRLPE